MVRKLRGWRVMGAVYYFFLVLGVILLFGMGGAKTVLYVYMPGGKGMGRPRNEAFFVSDALLPRIMHQVREM